VEERGMIAAPMMKAAPARRPVCVVEAPPLGLALLFFMEVAYSNNGDGCRLHVGEW